MADPTTNGVTRPDDPDPKSNRAKLNRFTKNPGKGYAPSSGAWYGYASALIDGAPIFTWLDVPRMLRDPQVQFGLRMLRAPFGKTEFDVRANSQGVSDFVTHTINRFWRRVVPKLLLKYFSWGYAAAIFEYSADNRQVRWRSGSVVEPRDAHPEVWRSGARAGQFAGFTLTAGQGGPVGISGSLGNDGLCEKVLAPHAMWFAGHEELGRLYDRPRIAGAFEPWLEKRGRNGAVHSRRLWYRKCAFSGGTAYYPLGTTDIGTADVPDVRMNQDIMREVVEKMENGGAMFLPSLFDGESGKRLWEFEDPKTRSDVGGVLDYPKELDREILIGLGIPPEVIEASEVGSGWSGRMIPAEAYLGSADELSGMLLHGFDESALRELVRHNFGSRARYEVEAKPLGETLVAKQQGGPGGQMPPGAQIPGGQSQSNRPDDGGNLASLFDGGGSNPGGGHGSIPYQGPRGGHGVKNPVTGRVRYGANLGHEAAPALTEQANGKPAGLDPEHAAAALYAMLATAEYGRRTGADPAHTQHALDALADLTANPEELARLLKAADLAWVAFTTARTTIGALNPDSGRKLYGQRAKAALESHARRTKREADAARARELLRQVYHGEAGSPEHFAELADHLPSLTVEQLHQARFYLDQSTPGAWKQNRDTLVRNLVQYAQGEADRRLTTPPEEWGPAPGEAIAADRQAHEDATPLDAAPVPADIAPVTSSEPTDDRPASPRPDAGPGPVSEPDRGGTDSGGVAGVPGSGGAEPTRPRIVTAREQFTRTGNPELVPASVRQHLNPAQQQGAALAIDAMTKHGGFLLADGTGVGKTRQQLAVAKHFLDAGNKVVIVSPAEVIKPDWKKGTMAGSFAHDSAAMGVPVKLTKGDAGLAPGSVHVTTYNELGKLKPHIDKNTVVLYDESHFMKNRDSARYKHGKDITDAAGAVLYATATPGDKPLHIAHLAKTGVFGNAGATKTYEKLGMRLVDQHIGKGQYRKVWQIDPKVGYGEAVRRLSGLFDQMTKDGLMVKRELSMDGVDVGMHHTPLTLEQHDEIDKVYKDTLAATDNNKAVALMAARLHQEPMKVPATAKMVQEELAAGRSPVVFVGRVNDIGSDDEDEPKAALAEAGHSSEGTASALKKALIAAGIPEADIGELHGGATKTADAKKKAMERFQSGKSKVMIATVQSGGTGINLDDTVGDRPRTVIMMTPPFTANDMAQAIGRVHRLNTKSAARVRGVLSDTEIDRWNAELLQKKFRTLGAIAGGESMKGSAAAGPESPGVGEDDKPAFEWGESLHTVPKFHANTPFAHNDKIKEFGGRRIELPRGSGNWTTEFPSKEHHDKYVAATRSTTPPPTIPPSSAAQATAAGAPGVSVRKVSTSRGERYVHSFPATKQYWDNVHKSRPSYLSVRKRDDGTWEVSIWGDTADEVNRHVEDLKKRMGAAANLSHETSHAPTGGVAVGGKQFAGGEFIPGEVMAAATPAERAAVVGKVPKSTAAPKDVKKKPATSSRKAPGAQMPDEAKARLRSLGMVGTFPPADVPAADIKIAEGTAAELEFKPLMQWNQTTKSGRISRQYRYTQAFHDRNAEAKFERVSAVEPHLAAARSALEKRMTDGGLSGRERDAAAIASVIAETGLRPTDGEESIAHGHYGIASLLAHHATVEGDSIALDFIGKEGVRNKTTIRHPANVAYLKTKLAEKSGDEPLWTAGSDDAGDALKAAVTAAGGPDDVKLKDLRTIKATQTARTVVGNYAGPPPPLTGDAKKDAKAIVAAVLKMSGEVATVLNNTAQQARDNYIHPEVFKSWQRTLESSLTVESSTRPKKTAKQS